MKKSIMITVAIILTVLACSIAWSVDNREVWLGGYMLLRVRCPAGGYTIDQRVDALQQRANNLLQTEKSALAVSVRISGSDASIYTDGTLFMTVTRADGKANGTTAEKLANIWAERLRHGFPMSSPDKPGAE